jgi:hypothetical protein
MNDEEQAQCIVWLKNTVRIASLPADQQVASFHPGLDIPFEIPDDYCHWCGCLTGDYRAKSFTDAQHAALVALVKHYDEKCGYCVFWQDLAVLHRPEWEESRRQARRIIELFGWDAE